MFICLYISNISYVVHDTVCRTQHRPTEIKYSHSILRTARSLKKVDIHICMKKNECDAMMRCSRQMIESDYLQRVLNWILNGQEKSQRGQFAFDSVGTPTSSIYVEQLIEWWDFCTKYASLALVITASNRNQCVRHIVRLTSVESKMWVHLKSMLHHLIRLAK